MSLELVDLKRLKITAETRAWLTSESQLTGKSVAEVAREALHDLAMKRIAAAASLTSVIRGIQR